MHLKFAFIIALAYTAHLVAAAPVLQFDIDDIDPWFKEHMNHCVKEALGTCIQEEEGYVSCFSSNRNDTVMLWYPQG